MRKIVIVENDISIINKFVTTLPLLKSPDAEIVNARLEYILKNIIENKDGNVYVFNAMYPNILEHIASIKEQNSTIPIFIYGGEHIVFKECNMQFVLDFEDYTETENITIILKNVLHYMQTFDKLLSVTTSVKEVLMFDEVFFYYPTSRSLYKDDILVKTMTNKEGSILEILLANYDEVVSKQLILEKIWGKNEHYASRCMDVYVSNLRKLLKLLGVKSKINAISGKNPGLIFTSK